MSKKYDDSSQVSKGVGIGVRRFIAYLVLILISLLCLFWFYVLFINATRSEGDLAKGFSLLPGTNFVENWNYMLDFPKFHMPPMPTGMINSVIVSVSTAALCTYFSTMTAYAIHAYDFKIKKFMFTFILAVMMIPTQVTVLGFLDLIREMNLEDNFIPLIVPSIASPVVFFYMKQYMDSVLPLSLVEAARIDGSGEFRTFNSIVLPLMKPAMAVQAIFSFVSSWNNYFVPSLILHKDEMMTLPIMIARLQSLDWQTRNPAGDYMAISFSIFPVILVYLILSKHIVQGLAMGSVKE